MTVGSALNTETKESRDDMAPDHSTSNERSVVAICANATRIFIFMTMPSRMRFTWRSMFFMPFFVLRRERSEAVL